MLTSIISYAIVGNPVSKKIGEFLWGQQTAVTNTTQALDNPVLTTSPTIRSLMYNDVNMIRIACVSGAAAVLIGAIGSRCHHNNTGKGNDSYSFGTANQFHAFHTLALFFVPLAKYPKVTTALMVVGNVMFCGVHYYQGLTGKRICRSIAPMGVTCLIMGWISFII
ncbi:transmembrane protein 256 homolog isoform X2 [Teleopsis dalmanni]|uniref:transmembrane protein 256 homolog isoform X2 n=1 Tax=Teleopsis dalmanni TaxID=139649 RepID=UPI0018CE8F01|nr:transmembrane protein 256 homolog isoform X2 [Teleopsis dalmanni]